MNFKLQLKSPAESFEWYVSSFIDLALNNNFKITNNLKNMSIFKKKGVWKNDRTDGRTNGWMNKQMDEVTLPLLELLVAAKKSGHNTIE